MKTRFFFCTLLTVCFLLGHTIAPRADLNYEAGQTEEGVRYLIVQGTFSADDNLIQFSEAVRSTNPSIIMFNSTGGNVIKAMELGHLIRALGLNTVQFRSLECSSACALAFLGGVVRIALPGSIGVHRSSFSDDHQISTQDAVSVIQEMTAEIMSYIFAMDADPGLLQLALRYDASDMRYLSTSEMEQFKVVTERIPISEERHAALEPSGPTFDQEIKTTESGPTRDEESVAPITPRTGRVRHPKGVVPLKSKAQGNSHNLTMLDNGTTLKITGNQGRWYRTLVKGYTGYLHHTWVYVDQYNSGPFHHRHIQVKSFPDLNSAKDYVLESRIPMVAYLATNGWYAITLRETFPEQTARILVKEMKDRGNIPNDSFMTYGNTYVQKVCCK